MAAGSKSLIDGQLTATLAALCARIREMVTRAEVLSSEVYTTAYEAMERVCVDDLTTDARGQSGYVNFLDFEIARVEEMPDGSGKLHLHCLRDREPFTSVRVTRQYMEQYQPAAGGYYLVARGGYKSFSPVELLFMVDCQADDQK